MTPAIQSKLLFVIPLGILCTFVASAAYVADQLLGVVALTYGYLAFCLLTALVFGAIWHACFRSFSWVSALVVFGILGANFFLPPPSERLLRSAMLAAKAGTDASAVVDIVKQKYEDSPYAMPWIHEDRAGGFDRIHVSLLSQEHRSCTSVIFLVENGRVSRSIYSPD
jgi:hypothetical protein